MKQYGLADSPFFVDSTKSSEVVLPPVPEKPAELRGGLPSMSSPMQSSNQATMQPSKHARLHATIDDSIIETIRKAVKGVGKEAGTFRFTAEEKKALLELAYMYRLQGHKTSENEITRIAVNFILEDYRHSGPGSILEKVLQALNK